MKKLIMLAGLFISCTMFSQEMKVVKGDFNFLKDQKEINIEFDYSNFTVMGDKKTELTS